MQILKMSIHELSNDPANARKHNDRNIDAIIASLRRFGQQKPIVVDSKGVVRAGNGTLEAAKRLGWEVIDCVKTSLEGSDAVAYAIADNRTAELAEWDDEMLSAQLDSLLTESEELALATGFTQDEMEAMIGDDTDGIGYYEDVNPEPSSTPPSERDYQASAIRQVILVLDQQQYVMVIEAMAEHAEKFGLSNNTEVILHLLETNGYAISKREDS